MLANPVAFNLHLEAALDHRISSELCQRALRELVYLEDMHLSSVKSGSAFGHLHERQHCTPRVRVPRRAIVRARRWKSSVTGTYLCKVELQRVICAQADVQANLEEVRKRVPLVCQEESVVAQRAHGQADLFEVEQVLKGWDLAKQNTVGNRMRQEVGRGQVVGVSSFTTMRTEHEGIFGATVSCMLQKNPDATLTESSLASPLVQARHIRKHVVHPSLLLVSTNGLGH